MPSSMIHLLTVYKINPKIPVNFLVGNMIPDSVCEWKAKDIESYSGENWLQA